MPVPQFQGTDGASNQQYVAEALIELVNLIKGVAPTVAAAFDSAVVAAACVLDNYED